MDVRAASALNLYNFNNTAQSRGRSAAVVQALAQIYSDSQPAAGADPLVSLMTTANMAPVVNAMYSLASPGTTGADALPVDALQANVFFGGVNAATASVLFSSNSATGSEGFQGFDAALNASSTIALSAYQASLKYSSATPAAPTQDPILSLLG